MEQQLVRLVVRGLAVVARDLDVEARGNDAAPNRLAAARSASAATLTAFSPLRLAMARLTAGRRSEPPVGFARHRPGAMVEFGRADDDIGDVLDIDRAARRAW